MRTNTTPSENQKTEAMQRVANFNRGRNDTAGKYIISTATTFRPYYSLWRVFPTQVAPLLIRTLALTLEEAVERTMQLLHNCNVALGVWDNTYFEPYYGQTDDIIPLGKYRGKRMSEIFYIDPPYVLWLAGKFQPEMKKYEKIVEIARQFAQVHFELTVTKKHIPSVSQYVGKVGEKLTDLQLTVINVRLQVDTYKPDYYVDQNVLAADRDGNRFIFLVKAAGKSLMPYQLNCRTRLVEKQQEVRIASAKVMSQYESRGVRYTRLGYVKFGG